MNAAAGRIDHAIAVVLAALAWLVSRLAAALLLFVFAYAVLTGAWLLIAGVLNFILAFFGV